MAARRLWSKEELILAFNLYLKLPFGKMHTGTPEIIELANLLGRSANSISIRLTNFASCDPYHKNRGIKGMVGGIKQCQPIWDEFFNNQEELIFLSEKILAKRENTSIEDKYKGLFLDLNDLKGETKIREVKTRVNQSVFRKIVLANYGTKCAISGIDIPELLFASHIIPWSVNRRERLNPENGICFSPLYDKAFDKGLIGVNQNYQVLISKDLKKKEKNPFYKKYFFHLDNFKISLPKNYLPKIEFLEYHLDTIFSKKDI